MHVEAIDLGRRRVTVRHHRSPVRQQVHHDKLVLARGAAPNVAIAPGAAEHALTFKTSRAGPICSTSGARARATRDRLAGGGRPNVSLQRAGDELR